METHHTTREAPAVSELLEDAGNCRQNTSQELNLHPLSDSLFSEQQKLRHVLGWVHRFLSNGSEVYHEFCRADSLILANEQDEKKREAERGSHTFKHSSPGSNEVLEGRSTGKVWQLKPSDNKNSEQNNSLSGYKPSLQDDLYIPLSFTPGRDEEIWPEMQLKRTTNKQTCCQDNCRASKLHISNQRHQTNISDSSTNQMLASDAAARLIKDSASCWSNVSYKKSPVFDAVSSLEPLLDSIDIIENQKELRNADEGMLEVEKETTDARLEGNDGRMHKGHESSSAFRVYANGNVSHTEPEKITRQMAKTANPTSTYHLKIQSNLTVYEQYQICVHQLHHLRARQSQHIEPQCFIESPAKGRKTSEETAAPIEASVIPTPCIELSSCTTNPEIKKHFNKARRKRVSAAEITEEGRSDPTDKNQDRTTQDRYRATLTEHKEPKHCDKLTVRENRPLCQKNTANGKKHGDFMKKTGETITSTEKIIDTPVEERAALTVLLPKKTECHSRPEMSSEWCQRSKEDKWRSTSLEALWKVKHVLVFADKWSIVKTSVSRSNQIHKESKQTNAPKETHTRGQK
ncbi:uncharacterized protein LOC127138956 [Lates calcarifer]|uniref:Uncharacterized protein LOC127138956 n=1 Tax=Lates calcarifer TaxID=8187 RepID=A0AAJ8BDT7_LATCA|nr:uncharacterized protein LOC127138956 [Lates calcarifer]